MNKLHKRPNPLRAAIAEIVKREMLREQEDKKDAPPPAPEGPSSPEPEAPSSDMDSGAGDEGPPDTGSTEDMGDDAGGALDSSMGDVGSMDGAGGPEGGDMDDLGDSMDDAGGGGMGGGGGFAGGMGGLGGGGGGGGGMDSGGDSGDGEEKSSGITPPGEPEKDPEDPVGAAVEEAEKIAGQTTDAQKILNALKASIQVNFSDYRQAWPVVERLRQTENKTLQAVASRLALFIADVLQENAKLSKKEEKTMKITNAELKEMIKRVINQKKLSEASAKSDKPAGGTVKINKEELREMIREAIKQKLLSEDAGYVEHERMRQEVNMLALEFLEKLTQKLNIDLATLSPEALEAYKRTHKVLEGSVRTAAAELFQLGAVLKVAQGPDTNS